MSDAAKSDAEIKQIRDETDVFLSGAVGARDPRGHDSTRGAVASRPGRRVANAAARRQRQLQAGREARRG